MPEIPEQKRILYAEVILTFPFFCQQNVKVVSDKYIVFVNS